MELRLVSCVAIILISLMITDARTIGSASPDERLCAKSEPIDGDDCLELPEETLDEVEEERSCIACKKAVRELIAKIKQPKMRTKIIEAILDYCEEADEEEEQCKQTIYKYGPVILEKLEKFKASELCSMMGMCGQKIQV